MTRPTSNPLRHDPARRHPGREHHAVSLADKLRIARMLDEYGMPYIEGGWPGSNPKDIEFFKAARTMTWQNAKLAAFGSTRHRVEPPRGRPEPARARRRGDARRHDLRQELAAPRDRGPRRDAEREPRHDRGLGPVRRRARSGERLRRGALLRRLQGRSRLRPRHAARGARGRQPDARPVRHERRDVDRRAARDRRRRPRDAGCRARRARGHVGDPHPQRRRAGRRQLDGRSLGRDPPRPGDDQRLRRALRQREHGLDPRQPRPEDPARAGARPVAARSTT